MKRQSARKQNAKTSLPPHLPSEVVNRANWRLRGRSSDLQAAYLLQLPGFHKASANRAFVPAYRCGAVPDFHRIPIFALCRGTKNHKVGPPYLGPDRYARPICGVHVEIAPRRLWNRGLPPTQCRELL